MTDSQLPLGRETAFPSKVDPALLFPIARSDNRADLWSGELPFHGMDICNAWDLTWLTAGNVPVCATAEIRVPASSENLIESKSLKLYLGSFAMSQFASAAAVADRMSADLGACAGAELEVRVLDIAKTATNVVSRLPGRCLDTLSVSCDSFAIDAALLKSDPESVIEEALHTHLLRSLCPVTGQPDIGSLAIHYRGPRMNPESVLRYVVSYREHNDFHEACIERMFVDILERCKPEKLSLHARYQRRGGIDINPFRSNFEDAPKNLRLWRQ